MKKYIILAVLLLLTISGSVYAQSVFRSWQVGADPDNGDCLTTNGTVSTWDTCGGSVASAYDIATTSDIAVPGLSYFTKTAGITTIGSVATTTLTASSPLSLSQPVVKVGGSNSVLSINTSGTWSGNAVTASALFANGGNCSSGNAPLGVDASGAVENCFDVWTESENTAAHYLGSYDAFTHPTAGTSATTSNFIFGSASSTVIGNFNITGNSTSTYATSTNLTVTGIASTSALYLGIGSGVLQTSANGLVSTFSSLSSLESLLGSINILASTEIDTCSKLSAIMTNVTGTCGNFVLSASPTLTGTLTAANILASASSTIGGGTLGSGLTIAGGATTTNLLVTASTTLQNFTARNSTTTNATTTGLLSTANLTASGSSTLQNVTMANSTSTNSTSTILAATTASTTNLYVGTGTGCLSASATGLVSANGVSCIAQNPNSKWATSTVDALAINPATALRVGIGTTTPQWALQIASSTGPQLTLSDPSSITNAHWSMRNAGGNFYLATSSPNTYATTTFESNFPPVTIFSNGRVSIGSSTPPTTDWLNIGSSTPFININTNAQMGFGGRNLSSSAITFGQGSNINVNPNISPMFQDPVDSRFGSCVNNVCAFLKSVGGKVGLAGYDYTGGASALLAIQEFGGRTAFNSSTTPWGLVSVEMDATANVPSFVVSNQGSTTPSLYVGNTSENGFIGMGTTTSTSSATRLVVGNQNDATNKAIATFANAAGVCYLSPIGGLTCASDRNLKKDFSRLEGGQLYKLMQLKPTRFRWVPQSEDEPTSVGLIAQEAEEEYPDLVFTDANGTKTLAYERLTVRIIAAVQELNMKQKVQDNWQWGVIALLLLYIGYNEWDKRRKW